MNTRYQWPFPGQALPGMNTYDLTLSNPDSVELSEYYGLVVKKSYAQTLHTHVNSWNNPLFTLRLAYSEVPFDIYTAFQAMLHDYFKWAYMDVPIRFHDWLGTGWQVRIDEPSLMADISHRKTGTRELFSFSILLKGHRLY